MAETETHEDKGSGWCWEHTRHAWAWYAYP